MKRSLTIIYARLPRESAEQDARSSCLIGDGHLATVANVTRIGNETEPHAPPAAFFAARSAVMSLCNWRVLDDQATEGL